MIRDIKIRPVLNGFIVDVGCQTIVYDDKAKMISDLSLYYQNPKAFEEEFMRTRAINKEFTMPNQSYEQRARATEAAMMAGGMFDTEGIARAWGTEAARAFKASTQSASEAIASKGSTTSQ